MASLVQHPTAVVIHRREPLRNTHWTPQASQRLPVQVGAQTAPKVNIEDSSFYGVGRDAPHSWGHIWRYTALAIQDKLSIASQFFGVEKVPSALVVNMPQGVQNPVRERVNIRQPPQVALGSKIEVQAQTVYHPVYAKII